MYLFASPEVAVYLKILEKADCFACLLLAWLRLSSKHLHHCKKPYCQDLKQACVQVHIFSGNISNGNQAHQMTSRICFTSG